MQSFWPTPAARRALLACGVFWLAMFNWRYPVLRLPTGYANLLTLWLFLLLPWGAAFSAIVWTRDRTRWLVVALALPSVVYGAIPLLGASFELYVTPFGESDESFVALRRLPLQRGGELVVYRTNCGATCSFGVVVRQERSLVPRMLLLVRDVYSRNGSDDARVEVIVPDRARVENGDVRLRAWVYL